MHKFSQEDIEMIIKNFDITLSDIHDLLIEVAERLETIEEKLEENHNA